MLICGIGQADPSPNSPQSCVLQLTPLAPDIVEATLGGGQAGGMTLPALMRPFLVTWEAQHGTPEGS